MAVLNSGGSALDAVEIAIRLLEDAEITNAGYGSNLNTDGVAEMDAMIMEGNGMSGAVGAATCMTGKNNRRNTGRLTSSSRQEPNHPRTQYSRSLQT